MAGNLFTLPKQVPLDLGVVLPAATLTFTQTGTTTAQNTYQDVALTIAHTNPVVADANGVFAPIYFDPSFSDYRVRLEDSAAALIYQVDGIPASQSGQSLTLTDAAPFINLIESDASANNTTWRIGVNGEQLTLQLANDALSSFQDILTIDRTANTVDAIALNGQLTVAEAVVLNAGSTSIGGDNLGRGWAIAKYKTSSTAITSDVFMGNDAELTYAIPATGTYRVEAFVTFWGSTAGVQGIRGNMNYSGTVSNGTRIMLSQDINGTVSTGLQNIPIGATTTAESFTAGDISTTAYIDSVHIIGTLIAGSTGTLAMGFRQDTTDANATNIGIGSYLLITKLS